MAIEIEHLAAALGVGLTTLGILKYRARNHQLKFNEVRYDPSSNEIELHIVNIGAKGMYVQPAIRLVRFTPIDELRQEAASQEAVPMMMAASGSVIRGYDLIGEPEEPISIDGRKKTVIRYPLPQELKLNFYDTIKVDSMVGSRSDMVGGFFSNTMKLTFMSKEESGEEEQEQSVPSCEASMLDGAVENGSTFSNPFDGGLMDDSESPSMSTVLAGTMEMMHDLEEDVDMCSIELIDNPLINLKPRHNKILDTLEEETTVTVKELATKLERTEKPVASDLRYLMGHDLVDRVKIRGMYKYFIIRGQQVVIHDGSEDDQDPMCT